MYGLIYLIFFFNRQIKQGAVMPWNWKVQNGAFFSCKVDQKIPAQNNPLFWYLACCEVSKQEVIESQSRKGVRGYQRLDEGCEKPSVLVRDFYCSGVWGADISQMKSFMGHISNKHTDHPNSLFSACAHEEIAPRRWIKIGMHFKFHTSCSVSVPAAQVLVNRLIRFFFFPFI